MRRAPLVEEEGGEQADTAQEGRVDGRIPEASLRMANESEGDPREP